MLMLGLFRFWYSTSLNVSKSVLYGEKAFALQSYFRFLKKEKSQQCCSQTTASS